MWQRVSSNIIRMGRSPAYGFPLIRKCAHILESKLPSSCFMIFNTIHYHRDRFDDSDDRYISQVVNQAYKGIYSTDKDTLVMAWKPNTPQFAVVTYNKTLHYDNWLNRRMLKLPKTVTQEDIHQLTCEINEKLT